MITRSSLLVDMLERDQDIVQEGLGLDRLGLDRRGLAAFEHWPGRDRAGERIVFLGLFRFAVKEAHSNPVSLPGRLRDECSLVHTSEGPEGHPELVDLAADRRSGMHPLGGPGLLDGGEQFGIGGLFELPPRQQCPPDRRRHGARRGQGR